MAGALVGLHSSDPATVYLAARARIDDLTIEHVEQSLYERKDTVRILGMRRTMFVVPPSMAATIDSACTQALVPQQRARVERILVDNAVTATPDAWLDALATSVVEALERIGPATAREIAAEVPEFAIRLRYPGGGVGGLSTRMLFLMATQGLIVRGRPRGSWVSSQYEWDLAERWLGAAVPPIDPAQARADLIARWLLTFGPATFVDAQWWSGWNKGHTSEALERAGAVEVALDDGTGFVARNDEGTETESEFWVALLPGLDPSVMGWKDRGWFLPDAHVAELFDRNGNAGPTAMANGRIVGGWSQTPDGEVVVELLEDVTSRESKALEAEAERLAGWLDGRVIKPRFPSPLAKRILAGEL